MILGRWPACASPSSQGLIIGIGVRIITEDGELLPQLTLDPTKTYQPTGWPKRPARS